MTIDPNLRLDPSIWNKGIEAMSAKHFDPNLDLNVCDDGGHNEAAASDNEKKNEEQQHRDPTIDPNLRLNPGIWNKDFEADSAKVSDPILPDEAHNGVKDNLHEAKNNDLEEKVNEIDKALAKSKENSEDMDELRKRMSAIFFNR